MEHQYSDRIVRLLQLYLLGDITEEERQELEELEIENYLNKFAKRIYFRKNDMFMKRSMIQRLSLFLKNV